MTRDELIENIKELDVEDTEAIDVLAEQISLESRQLTRNLVESWNEGPEPISIKAGALYARLDELSISPLLGITYLSNEKIAVRAMSLVDAQLTARHKIVAHLVSLLDDERVLDVPDPSTSRPVEEHPPEQRIRDVAYLELRRLLHYAESEDAFVENAAIYLDLDFEDRDEEIELARASENWDRWMDESE